MASKTSRGCLEDTGNTCDANTKKRTPGPPCVVFGGTRARARGVDVRERARDGRARIVAHAGIVGNATRQEYGACGARELDEV